MPSSGSQGFRGVSQSLGHHIANDAIRDWVFPLYDKAKKEGEIKSEAGAYDVALIGDYNIGGDAWASRLLLEEMGLRVVAQWSDCALKLRIVLLVYCVYTKSHDSRICKGFDHRAS